MREIIFKAKRVDNGEWVEGSPSYGEDMVFMVRQITGHIKRDDYECYAVEVDPETVCQFTGLIDKNGKKIFEGDIVGYLDESANPSQCGTTWEPFYNKGTIEYDKEHACFTVTNRLDVDLEQFWDDHENTEIIGNIHDKKEGSNGKEETKNS